MNKFTFKGTWNEVQGKLKQNTRSLPTMILLTPKAKEDELLDVCKSARVGHRRNQGYSVTELGWSGSGGKEISLWPLGVASGS